MGKPYDERTKAAALAMIATGASQRSVERETGVSRRSLNDWRKAAGMTDPPTVSPQKRADLGEQLYEYLQESISTLVAQLRFARDPDWLARQNAADLAVFMGVAADKTTRTSRGFPTGRTRRTHNHRRQRQRGIAAPRQSTGPAATLSYAPLRVKSYAMLMWRATIRTRSSPTPLTA